VNLLSIIEVLGSQEEDQTFSGVAASPQKWQPTSYRVLIHDEYDYTYFYNSIEPIVQKNKNIKKKYPIHHVESVQDLLEGPSTLRGDTNAAIWRAASRSLRRLETEILETFFEPGCENRPTIEASSMLTDPEDDEDPPTGWENVLGDIFHGKLFPSHLRRVIDARTAHMQRHIEILKYVRENPASVEAPTKYKIHWKSPEQPPRNIADHPHPKFSTPPVPFPASVMQKKKRKRN
jgi:hypothetical protein